MSIVSAMEAPDLFGPFFKGDSWRGWKTFLRALTGDTLQGADLDVYRHHTGRTTPPAGPFKEAALICGRRGGKSRILALIATYQAVVPDYRPYLAPGEVATVAVIAADRKQARAIFRFVLGMLKAVPELAALIERETNDTIELSNSVSIEIHTASFRVTRGYTMAACLCDEVAFWRSEDSANPDQEILDALRPALATIPGSMLLIASSPFARRGALYAAFRRHFAKDESRVLVWRGTTSEMNPRIDPAIIAEAYQEDATAAAAEYGAQFRDDIAAFVTRETVDACTVPGRLELPPISGLQYVAFVDPSGGSADSMTLAIAHRENDRAVLDAVREVKPPFSPEAVTAEFCALVKAYGVSSVTGDRYAGEWAREPFRKAGVDYLLAEKPRSDLYRDLLPVLNSGQCELLDLPRLATQLCGLERRTARSGRDSIDHAPGGHDDVANAVAGALLMAGKNTGFDSSYDWIGTPDELATLFRQW